MLLSCLIECLPNKKKMNLFFNFEFHLIIHLQNFPNKKKASKNKRWPKALGPSNCDVSMVTRYNHCYDNHTSIY